MMLVIKMIEKTYIYITDCIDPYVNIATERYLLENVPENACILYLWQNKNTVVIGRNQNAWAECRTSLLEEEGGNLARRLSGGGAVYHDLGNLNFTFLVGSSDYDLDKQLSVIQTACGYAGITAEKSGRNDLLAQGQKFSGNAFYHAQGKSYHHGTLLIDADMEKLSRYLTPSRAKLETKGVSSVRSRVVNLKELSPDLTCDTMKALMEKAFGKVYGLTPSPFMLSGAAQEQIHTYAAQLQGWDWLYGPKLPFTFSCEARFAWGSFALELQVEAGIVKAVGINTDAMDWQLADTVKTALTGCRFQTDALRDALSRHITEDFIRTDLCDLIKKQSL